MLKKALGIVIMSAALAAMPAFAGESATENEAALSGESTTEDEAMLSGNVTTEIVNGNLTIRIEAQDADDPEYYWELYDGDKGDASFFELLTQSTMEDGLAYAGSFRAIDDETADDTIILVHTNGKYAKEAQTFDIHVENGAITEAALGGVIYGTTGEELEPYLAGVWEETDGNRVIDAVLGDDGELHFTISDGSGRDGRTHFITMTVYYDCMIDTLVYWDGTLHEAAITASADQDAADTILEEEGTGKFGMIPETGEDGEAITLAWYDDTFGNNDTGIFVKTE